jgi:hypothetical protein
MRFSYDFIPFNFRLIVLRVLFLIEYFYTNLFYTYNHVQYKQSYMIAFIQEIS